MVLIPEMNQVLYGLAYQFNVGFSDIQCFVALLVNVFCSIVVSCRVSGDICHSRILQDLVIEPR